MAERPPGAGGPDLDRVLRRALEEAAVRIPLPDPAPVLRRPLGELAARRRRRRALSLAAAAVALILVAAASPWRPPAPAVPPAGPAAPMVALPDRPAHPAGREPSPAPAPKAPPPPALPAGEPQAAGEPRVLIGQVAGPAGPTRGSEGSPPVPERVTLAEAARRAPFPLRYPGWLPPDTGLLAVTLLRDPATGAVEVVLHFGGPEGRDLELRQAGPLPPEDVPAGGRRVEVDGHPAVVRESEGWGPWPILRVTWYADGVRHRASSEWDEEITLRVVRSLRPLGSGR